MTGQQMSIFDDIPRYKIRKPIRLIELFGGIGAQAKALERLGANFEHYRLCEFDKYAVKSYNAIHGTDFETSDIRELHAEDLGIVDTDNYEYIMTYSFPCQDISNAGLQRGFSRDSGTRSGLLWEVERLLKEMNERPQILLMENVPGVCGTQNERDFNEWIRFLESVGYSNFYKILNAKDYGVPQNRERCFMVSILGDYWYDFPEPKPLTLRLKDLLEKEVDEKYYLSDARIEMFATYAERKQYKMCGFKFAPTRGEGIANTVLTKAGERRCDNFIIDGSQATIVPTIWGSTQKNAAQKNDGICPTLTEAMGMGGGQVPLHNYDLRIRKLTPKECFRLMDFDDEDIDKCVAAGISNSQLYKQAGNSIVVSVLEEIFRQLL